MPTTPVTTAVAVDAPGHYGDYTTVWYAGSLSGAHRYARRHPNVQIIVGCHAKKGDRLRRSELMTMLSAGFWSSVR